jgi:hypothetical protein
MYNYINLVKKDKVERTCSIHGAEEEWIYLSGERDKFKDQYEKLDVGGRIIFKWILEEYDEVYRMDWSDLG